MVWALSSSYDSSAILDCYMRFSTYLTFMFCVFLWTYNLSLGCRTFLWTYRNKDRIKQKLKVFNNNRKTLRKNICSRWKWHKWFFVIKVFWLTVRKNCSSDWEKLLKFNAEDQEFAKFLRSLEQFIQTVKGQNNFW